MKIGLIVNPIAGLGGKTGLKGTDGQKAITEALRLGAKKESAERAQQALHPLKFLTGKFSIVTCSGEMGEYVCSNLRLSPTIISVSTTNTTKSDTKNAVTKMVEQKVSLILFAGGDGTACDILESLGGNTPILGIPTGVKMHSALFGTSPSSVGVLVSQIVKDGYDSFPIRAAEVMDLDENLRKHELIQTKLVGYVNIPDNQLLTQNPKNHAIPTDDQSIEGLSQFFKKNLRQDAIYIVGPGKTTYTILKKIGITGTLLGVDVIKGKTLISHDVNEHQLEALPTNSPIYIISGIIGGQGFLFGRGNQQITPKIIRRVSKKNILVIATPAKIHSLQEQSLLVDTGDKKLDHELAGYIKVRTNKHNTHVMRIKAA